MKKNTNAVRIKKFKQILLDMKNNIINFGYVHNNIDMTIPPEEMPDEADQATILEAQEVNFQLRDRELHKLQEIDMSLERCENGTYGYCEECGEEIPEQRLIKMPLSTMCLEHAEEAEEFTSTHKNSNLVA